MMGRRLKNRDDNDWAEEAQRVARIGRAADQEADQEWRTLVQHLCDILVMLLLSRNSVDTARKKLRSLLRRT